MTNPIIILGSSRTFGETRKVVDSIIGNSEVPIIDLKSLDMSIYDHYNKNDDFIPLMEQVIKHDLIVLATPVYWYTMSATMKIFLDRLTDLLDIRKDLGRKLYGKKLFIISSLASNLLPQGFEYPFWQTAEYLKMEYKGCIFISSSKNPECQKNNELETQKAKAVLFKS